MIIGVIGVSLPAPIINSIDTLGGAMSPIAMLLTGMTLAKSNLLSLLGRGKVWLLSLTRLILFPIAFLLILSLIPRGGIFTDTALICAVASLAMPLGLNTIVIPTGYGLDTSDASSMALISHFMSVLTLPLVFMLVELLV
jgi:predicted permease